MCLRLTHKEDRSTGELFIHRRSQEQCLLSPFFELSKLSPHQRLDFLSETHTVEEWVLLFDTIDNCNEVLEEAEMAGVKNRALATKNTAITPRKRVAHYDSSSLTDYALG